MRGRRLDFNIALGIALLLWPLFVFRHHWTTHGRLYCKAHPGLGAYSDDMSTNFSVPKSVVVTTTQSAISSTGVVVTIAWGVLYVVVIAVLVARNWNRIRTLDWLRG